MRFGNWCDAIPPPCVSRQETPPPDGRCRRFLHSAQNAVTWLTLPRTPSLQLCRWCAQSAFSNLAIRRWALVPRRFRWPVFSVGPRGRTNPGPWLPPLPPFSTPQAHQACLDRGSVKTGPQVAGRGGHTLRRRRCRLSSYARLWPTYSGTATSYQPLETLLSQFICSSRSLMSDGQRAQRDGMETIKLDSKWNLSKKPAFARGYRADSHRDTITEALICPRPQPYTVDAHTNIIRGAGVISKPCHSRPSCSNPKASCKKQAPSHCHIYTVGVGQQPMLS